MAYIPELDHEGHLHVTESESAVFSIRLSELVMETVQVYVETRDVGGALGK